jgi:hypothetical protein
MISMVAFAAEPFQPDLKSVPSGKGWKGTLANASLAEKDGLPAIEMKGPLTLIWLDGLEFDSGIIEFDAKGKSAPPQSNFLGIAFRVKDEQTYDAIYFRPFNFRAAEPERKAHAVQYVSHPQWTWSLLRQERTGQFEKPIEPAPDGDAWFHARIVIEKPKISVYVNGASQPSLLVDELSDRRGGSVGIWSNSYGMIANLKITPVQ